MSGVIVQRTVSHDADKSSSNTSLRTTRTDLSAAGAKPDTPQTLIAKRSSPGLLAEGRPEPSSLRFLVEV